MAIPDFKIQHFLIDHPGESFPWFESLAVDEARLVQRQLFDHHGLGGVHDLAECHDQLFASAIVDLSVQLGRDDEMFDLVALLQRWQLQAERVVYLGWSQGEIDRMELSDVARCFDDLWYPLADDLMIHDASLSWVVWVTHYGDVCVTRE